MLASVELLLAIVGLGVALRVAQYLSDRSLWLDEALLALNIIDRSPTELFETLDFNQAAPPGFLLLENVVAAFLGDSELALRAIPLLAGIASVLVFAWLARRLMSPLPALFATLLFSVADGVIYYASELKPYSLDVLATLLLLAGAYLLVDGALSRRMAGMFGVLGSLLMSLSYAALLVAVSIGVSFLLSAARERRATNVTRGIPLLIWVVFGTIIAVYARSKTAGIRAAFEIESSTNAGFASASPGDLLHQLNVFGTDLLGTLGFLDESPWTHLYKVAAFSFAVGAIGLGRRAPLRLLLLLGPIGAALLASSVGLYPLAPRTILFLVPIVALLLSIGLATTASWIPLRFRLVSALIGLGLVLGPVWTAAQAVAHPRRHEELKPVLAYIQDSWQAGDTLYVHYAAQYALLYYDECRCLAERGPPDTPSRLTGPRSPAQFHPALPAASRDILVGPYAGGDLERQRADLRRLPLGERVWFLYTHVGSPLEERLIEQQLIGRLEELGTQIARIDRAGAHAYLFELR